MVKILVDHREIEVKEGMSLLQTCLENEIYIPNLCYLEGMEHPPASCRMCFVEIEGEQRPVASCTVQVRDGMIVKTDTPIVRRLQCSALRLLLSVHDVDCAHCPANKKCELQRIAKFLKVDLKPKPLEQFLKEPEIEEEHPVLNYYPNRCVLCGKCVFVSGKQHGKPFLTFAKRGFETVVTFYGEEGVPQFPNKMYIACVEICPVGAITLKNKDHGLPVRKKIP
ncbi:MAG: (2Fe-2S)-binding protein [Deltaproteobacteria bacterium]|nr:MAG: (2Fe-2S)-binding protein [Deltaproteobacteria bacterium]